MKKILVPIDFSNHSVTSLRYAMMVAAKMNSSIVVLHVIDISNSEMMLKRARLEEEVIANSKEDAAKIIDEARAGSGENVDITYDYRLGHPAHKIIANYVKQHDVALIVMGLHGETGLRKVLMGSTTTSLIHETSVPVIAVPQAASLDLEKIFYATDLTNLNAELTRLVQFARFFGASIHVVHVTNDPSVDKKQIREQIRRIDYSDIYFHVLHGEQVTRILETFLRRAKAHLLVTFTHKLDFFEKLFGKSITEELAANNQLPLLTFNRDGE